MFARIVDGALVEERETAPEIPEGEPAQDWRPLVIDYPDYDRATHQVGNPIDVIEAGQVTRMWDVSARSDIKSTLAEYAAAKRYAVMVSGVTVNGVTIPGDDVAQQRLKSARDLLVLGSITEPITLVVGLASWNATAADLTSIINALAAKTQAAFAVQGAVVQSINAGSITTTAQIDGAAWPA